jgi:hypothetical protein
LSSSMARRRPSPPVCPPRSSHAPAGRGLCPPARGGAAQRRQRSDCGWARHERLSGGAGTTVKFGDRFGKPVARGCAGDKSTPRKGCDCDAFHVTLATSRWPRHAGQVTLAKSRSARCSRPRRRAIKIAGARPAFSQPRAQGW